MKNSLKNTGVFILTIFLIISFAACGGDDGINIPPRYSLSDLVGTWEVNSLASGPGAPWWERGPITINSDGSFSGRLDEYKSDPDDISGTFNISIDGIITMVDRDDFRGSMDSGKTVIVGTNTWSTGSPGTTSIQVITKMAGSYSLSDLAGTWEVNSLASGPGAPWWERGTLEIDPNGSFSASVTESDGTTGNPSGTLNISTDGIITMVGSDDLRGNMDSGKTVMVWTDTWSTGTTDIKIITKMAD